MDTDNGRVPTGNRLSSTIKPPSAGSLDATRFDPARDRFYIDCEFDGHGGDLLSIALVPENGAGWHIRAIDGTVTDPWVIENVAQILDQHEAESDIGTFTNNIGSVLRRLMGDVEAPVIIADSPVDIGRFCIAISTSPESGWASADYPRMTFEVHNVDCYPTDLPGAVRHNAWWDAMALRHKLRDNGSDPKGGDATAAPGEASQSGLSESEGIAQGPSK